MPVNGVNNSGHASGSFPEDYDTFMVAHKREGGPAAPAIKVVVALKSEGSVEQFPPLALRRSASGNVRSRAMAPERGVLLSDPLSVHVANADQAETVVPMSDVQPQVARMLQEAGEAYPQGL